MPGELFPEDGDALLPSSLSSLFPLLPNPNFLNKKTAKFNYEYPMTRDARGLSTQTLITTPTLNQVRKKIPSGPESLHHYPNSQFPSITSTYTRKYVIQLIFKHGNGSNYHWLSRLFQ